VIAGKASWHGSACLTMDQISYLGYVTREQVVTQQHPAVQGAGATSLPNSPNQHAQKPPIHMNKAATARATAVQQKLQQERQQQGLCMVRAATGVSAPGGANTGQLASVVAALHRKAHELDSPEKTARPYYARHSSTPVVNRIPAFSGEAGVEPYSVRPAEREGLLVADTAAAPPAAAAAALDDPSSPLSANKYQADRAEYLQVSLLDAEAGALHACSTLYFAAHECVLS
jgi:hypothetical protein